MSTNDPLNEQPAAPSANMTENAPTYLQVSGNGGNFLVETVKWCKFLSIVAFVGVGFIVLIAFAMMAFFSSTTETDPSMPFNMGWFGLIYLAFGALFLFPSLYLYRFSDRMSNALQSTDQAQFQEALENLKSFFKFFGIYTAVFLIMYALILVGAIIGGALTSVFS